MQSLSVIPQQERDSPSAFEKERTFLDSTCITLDCVLAVVCVVNRACARTTRTHCRSTDSFIGMTLMGRRQSMANVEECLQRVSSTGSVEFMVHPGHPLDAAIHTRENAGCGGTLGPDEFSRSPDRQFELDCLMGDRFREYVTDNSIVLSAFQYIVQWKGVQSIRQFHHVH